MAPVHLGFCVEIESEEQLESVAHRSPKVQDWDGGQTGDRPSWLDPAKVPLGPIECRHCQQSMRFITQIYAPVDYDDSDRAFHRSIYVFACPKCSESEGSVAVLRCQLPKVNPYYPDDDIEEVNWRNHLPEEHNVSLCKVCGLKATKKCPVQQEYFCGKLHQKEFKKCIYDRPDDPLPIPSVYPIFQVVVEDEPEETKRQVPVDEEVTELDDDDSDKDLEQDDLNEMTGAKGLTDPTAQKFFERIRNRENVAEQCLRYSRWNSGDSDESGPLWIRQDQQPREIPNCPQCEGERKFEFQVMPQMLDFLLKDRRKAHAMEYAASIREALEQTNTIVQESPPMMVPPTLVDARERVLNKIRNELFGSETDIDWGVIAIYTCTNSCCSEGYVEEYGWKQQSLDL